MKTIIVGDVHASWNKLNIIINKKNPDIILQCGDFGFWPGIKQYKSKRNWIFGKAPVKLWPPKIKNGNTKIYWTPGNHENWWQLLERGQFEEPKNVFYMPKGSVIKLPDGRNVMFFGGAESIDRETRRIGFDWFPEETITYSDVLNLPDIEIDIMITHTCPKDFKILTHHYMSGAVVEAKYRDPSKEALSTLLNYYRPKLWYFGHYHYYQKGVHTYKESETVCKWTCLSHVDSSTRCWCWID